MKEKPITSFEDFADINVQAIAKAFEAHEGEPLPELREALEQAKRGKVARVTTPEQMLIRQA